MGTCKHAYESRLCVRFDLIVIRSETTFSSIYGRYGRWATKPSLTILVHLY